MKHKIIILLLFFTSFLYSEPWDDYKLSNIVELINTINESIKGHNGAGINYYKQGYFLPYEWTENDNILKISDQYYEEISLYAKSFIHEDIQNDFINSFGYFQETKYEDYNIILIYQSVLVPYFIEEVNIGDTVMLFAMLGLYNEFTKTVILFINEFEVIS